MGKLRSEASSTSPPPLSRPVEPAPNSAFPRMDPPPPYEVSASSRTSSAHSNDRLQQDTASNHGDTSPPTHAHAHAQPTQVQAQPHQDPTTQHNRAAYQQQTKQKPAEGCLTFGNGASGCMNYGDHAEGKFGFCGKKEILMPPLRDGY